MRGLYPSLRSLRHERLRAERGQFDSEGEDMAEIKGKGFESPDEVRPFKDGKGQVELVDLNGHMIGRGTFEPGWRWSEHVKPLSGTDSCQVEHIGYVLEGEMTGRMDDGDRKSGV